MKKYILSVGLGFLVCCGLLGVNTIQAQETGLAIDKVGPEIATVGEQITYEINWWVNGEEIVSQVVITDYLPEHTSFVSASNGGVYDPDTNTITWQLGNLAAPASGTLSLTLQVEGPVYEWDLLVNRAVLSAECHQPVEVVFSTEIDAHCDLQLEKQAELIPVTAHSGYSTYESYFLDYTITVSNVGDAICTGGGVELIEVYDSYFEVLSYSQEPELIFPSIWCSYSPLPAGYEDICLLEDPVDIWRWWEIFPGETQQVEINTQVSSQAEPGQVITNRICLNAYEIEPICLTQETQLPEGPSLTVEIDKQAASYVQAGSQLTYTIDWSVGGNGIASQVTVEDILPTGVEFVSASDGGVEHIDGVVTWHLGDIMAPAAGTFTLVVSVDELFLGQLENSVQIFSGQLSATASAVTQVGEEPFLLEIEKIGPAYVQIGNEVEYTINWSVDGVGILPGVTIGDTLPVGVEFVSASDSGVYDLGIITWVLGDLTPPASGTLSLVVLVPEEFAGSELLNLVEIISGDYSSSASLVTQVGSEPFLMQIEKLAPVYVQPSSQITYLINWSVIGQGVTDIIITDSLANNIEVVSADPAASHLNTQCTDSEEYHECQTDVVWEFKDVELPAGGSISLVVSLPQNLPGSELENLVEMTVGELSVSASALSMIGEEPADGDGGRGGSGPSWGSTIDFVYLLEKIVGQTATETVIVLNTASGILPAGTLTLRLPSELELVSADPVWESYNTSTQEVLWQVPELGLDGSFQLIFSVKPLVKGNNVLTQVVYNNERSPASQDVYENIVLGEKEEEEPIPPSGAEEEGEEPTPPPAPPSPPALPVPPAVLPTPTPTPTPSIPPALIPPALIPPAVAGEVTGPEQVAGEEVGMGEGEVPAEAAATVKAACEKCDWLIVMILVLLHTAVLLSFYLLHKEPRDIWWILILILIVAIVLLLIYCGLQPWWLLILIGISYFIGLFDYHYILKRSKLTNLWWLTYLLIILLAILLLLSCLNWYSWFWLPIVILFLLCFLTVFYQVIRQETKIWWLNPILLTLLILVFEILIKWCQCGVRVI